jgi:polysaccharide export outer membrane protein
MLNKILVILFVLIFTLYSNVYAKKIKLLKIFEKTDITSEDNKQQSNEASTVSKTTDPVDAFNFNINLSSKTQTSSSELDIPQELLPIINSTNKEDKISFFDVIEIKVYQENDLSKTIRVSSDGYISFPFIGKIKIDELTVIEAENKIEALLEKDYIFNPKVSIDIKEYYSKNVFVAGEVKSPGSYKIPRNKNMTVIETIILAGGFTEIASTDKIRIIRIENGIKKVIYVKAKDILELGDKSEDIILQPDDIIFVPQRKF